jgi:hypothetical protein
MTATILFILWKLLLPALVIVAIVDVLTQSPEQRIRRLRSAGCSQRAIAARLGISTYRVRKALA